MNTQPVKTIKDDEKTPGRMKALISAKTGTAQGDELDMLAALFDVYEQQHTPIEAADPVGAILFRIAKQGLERKDLEPFIGSRHRVSEIPGRKRRPPWNDPSATSGSGNFSGNYSWESSVLSPGQDDRPPWRDFYT